MLFSANPQNLQGSTIFDSAGACVDASPALEQGRYGMAVEMPSVDGGTRWDRRLVARAVPAAIRISKTDAADDLP